MSDGKQLNSFETSVKIMDHDRRIDELEADMKNIKPIVYDTANSVKNIEKSVSKMEANSDRMRGYLLSAVIVALVGLVFTAIKGYYGG